MSLLDRRLLLFTGKGGVGKSSVVAGLALHAAAAGKRPLVVELGHRASLQGLLEVEAVGPRPTEVCSQPPVWAVNIDPQHALEDMIYAQVKVRRIARGICKNRLLQRLFAAAPAVSELVCVDTIAELERTSENGEPKFSPIIVDLDATGHALMFLDLPRVMRQLLAGPLRKVVDDAAELFVDRERTALCLVTLPGEVPVEETLDLCRRLEQSEIRPSLIFANRVPSPPLSPDLVPAYQQLQKLGLPHPAWSALAHRMHMHQNARTALARLAQQSPLPIVELPEIAPGRSGLAQLGAAAAKGVCT